MPVDARGNHVDAMLNPASVPSRVNPGQMYEAMEGKRAKLTGKVSIIDNFDPADSSEKVLAKMKKDNIPIEEPLYDPKTGKELGKVFTGNSYIIGTAVQSREVAFCLFMQFNDI
jgi:DNA-directed RNA polymerase beta subunit